MKIIQPNCRAQFTADDLDFIVSALAPEGPRSAALAGLFADPDSLDAILDDEALARTVLERPGFLRVSRHFYFYILVRHVLRRAGIDDRGVADYVGSLLAEFSTLERVRKPVDGVEGPLDCLVDILLALQKADDRGRFLLQAHVGNHSLFLSGVFPERILCRARRHGAPEMEYYESMGSANYRAAGDHRLARAFDLTAIFAVLAGRFREVRRALNDMTDRLVSLGESWAAPPAWTHPAGSRG